MQYYNTQYFQVISFRGDLFKYIYIYIYTYIEMIDCGESDSMIEIYGKLDKSST